ncbi:uncharacterized protein LAESUDRAFT_704493 [Laetiporus sulphureus 93-53]|uniref:PQ-loop-domain-containing protein n=1 Tax=Laetiporus sulphureus 93-53 TaxID=1314785 RepID=A0A165CVN7_9APHY|nr:uncharacterized protein LAESUDRAFT_704493 [Laetiporus sulphureus 93-53]KZT03515.1 hypothetical protein LAESUDRAFT_704493 [Laetiporus sulphureus 93-53]
MSCTVGRGTICWTVQLIPQIWKSWRTKSIEGLSEYLPLFWGVASAPLGVYAIVQDLNIPLILQPQLFGALCFAPWLQCQYYGRKRSLRTCLLLYAACTITMVGFELGMVYAVRPSYRKGNTRGVEFFGILSSIMISLALLPQYYEIYQLREVIGISIPFMTIDMLGEVFSNLSLAFKSSFDVVAGVTYSIVFTWLQVMDGLIILLALILNPLARRRAALNVSNGEHDEQPNSAGVDLASCTTAYVP